MIMFLMTLHLTGQDDAHLAGQPLEVVEVDGIRVPVYDFEGLHPMLAAKDDRTYVINFWATWCRPCVEELPHFIRLSREMSGEKVTFVFVSLDFRKNLESGVIPFIRERGMDKNVVMLNDPDANRWISRVDPSWSGAIPATLVYRNGKKEFFEKKLSYEELKSIVESL